MTDTHHPEENLGGSGEELYQRPGDERQGEHGFCDDSGNGFGVCLTNTLGHQFTQNDAEISNHDNDQGRGQPTGGFMRDPQTFQPVGNRCRECGFGDDTIQNANGGDADLHCG